MSKQYSNNSELQNKILKGVNKLADNVATTMGPRGRNVIIKNSGQRPFITKDGVTVAASISFEDPFENIGAQLVRQATSKTNVEAGDGTTTSTVLTRAMLEYGFAGLEQDRNVTEIKKGMQHATDQAVSSLKEASSEMRTVNEIRHVAYVSSNGDKQITDIICEASTAVGKGGSITVEEANSNITSLELLEGFSFSSGLAAKAFATDERLGICRYENPLFLVTDEKLESVEQILPSLEIAAREGRPLLIVSDEVEGQALAALVMNSVRGSMKVAAVKSPRYGEERRQLMQDLCCTVGAKYFSQFLGNSLSGAEVSIEDFGSAKSVVVSAHETTIVGGLGSPEKISQRMSDIETQLSTNTEERELSFLLERKTKLSSGVAVVRVGAPTEVEMLEKKHRIEDALEAVKSALQEGFVPGGGLTLCSISDIIEVQENKKPCTDSFRYGFEIVRRALKAPIEELCKNAQENFADISADIQFDLESGTFIGFDFATATHVDMISSGIIDPTKVTRCALENATSVASTLLTTNVAIVED